MQWNDHTIPTSLTVELLWYHRYNIIVHANLLINGIAESGFTDTPELNEILGQALTYRNSTDAPDAPAGAKMSSFCSGSGP